MSKRGSMQLLLLYLRPRARLGWKIGAVAGFLVLIAALHAGGEFPLMARTGLAQVLRQSAWEQALAGLPAPVPLPWADVSQETNANVPLLGLSAAILNQDGRPANDQRSSPPQSERAGGTAEVPRTTLSDVEVGDKITVTAADGASRVYQITGRRVVDPHLAETEDGPTDEDVSLVTCSPLDPLSSSLRLIIQAIKVDPPAAPEPSPEQKL